MYKHSKNITFMIHLSENIQVKLSKDEKHYLDVISEKYHYKRCQFIREAIKEKMQRDVPKMRKEAKKEYCPF